MCTNILTDHIGDDSQMKVAYDIDCFTTAWALEIVLVLDASEPSKQFRNRHMGWERISGPVKRGGEIVINLTPPGPNPMPQSSDLVK